MPPAVAKPEGAAVGVLILWRVGLPMHAPVGQTGIVLAQGRTTHATVRWPGLTDIEFVSVYFDTGDIGSDLNMQIIADLG